MRNSSLKNKRNFIPKQIGDTLYNVNQKFLYKFGKIDFVIYSKWPEIVGDFFVEHSEPLKINLVPISENEKGETVYEKYLHINVAPSLALEFQHFQKKIIEKINSYFGYEAIKGIKIHQKLVDYDKMNIKKVRSIKNKKDNLKNVKLSSSHINDKELEQSIVNLGLSITNEDK